MSLDMQALIDRLNPICKKSLESAAQLCVANTHFAVEVEHFIVRLLEDPNSDAWKLAKMYNVRPSTLRRELTRSIENFKRGNTLTPALSPDMILLFEQAWLASSLIVGSENIRSGAIVVALLDHDALRAMILKSAPSYKKISVAAMKRDLREVLSHADEGADTDDTDMEPGLFPGLAAKSKTPALDQYTVDLTEQARSGELDPIQGRDGEIRQIIDILTRRRQNNPILTGDAGVGKTAVVEGFAMRVATGDVPPSLAGISLKLLDLGLLQAGAGIKGEFEKRVKSVIDEVKASTKPIILFIDEAHSLIGAGGPPGMSDAANLLKPALARGELRTIAATTWLEYKKYFEKDPALARRFQVVRVVEPDEDAAVLMLRATVPHLELHHGVTILDDAVRDAVRLSSRYITGRQLPEKAVSVLDTACARVALRQSVTPPEIEDLIRRMQQLEQEIGILNREERDGLDHSDRLANLAEILSGMRHEKQVLDIRWKDELDIVQHVLKLRENLAALAQSKNNGNKDAGLLSEELVRRRRDLEKLQKGTPMVPVCVDPHAVASVVSDWTGVPVGKMLSNEIETILELEQRLGERIIGQKQAIETISRRIMTYRADLDDPDRPVGVFFLVGPSGVGKTESAVALADTLYGGERNMVVVNMGEYQEAYSVSGLKGAPPGYVGHGRGGLLTEAVRQNPYTVVLLDEVEKAHPDVLELFYHVFDKGSLEDSEGQVVDFKNTVIILTSNIGADIFVPRESGQTEDMDIADRPPAEDAGLRLRAELLKHFSAAFLSRLVLVPFYPLLDEDLQKIVRLKLDLVTERIRTNHRIELTYDDELVTAVAARCLEVDTGARNVDYIITQLLLPDLSGELLRRLAGEERCTSVHLTLSPDGEFDYRFDPPVKPDYPPLPLFDQFLSLEAKEGFEATDSGSVNGFGETVSEEVGEAEAESEKPSEEELLSEALEDKKPSFWARFMGIFR